MDLLLEDTLKFGITLLSILNPIGALPIYLSITKSHDKEAIKKISNSCSLAVVITILLGLTLGESVLDFFGISVSSFTIGGGILIFSMAFSMIQAKSSGAKLNQEEIEDYNPTEVGIVPLAIPLLSGPGAISSAIIYSRNIETPSSWASAIIAILFIGIIVKGVLSYGQLIGNKIGAIGLNVMTRVMGIILLAVSIEMILGGVKEILPILKTSITS